MVVVPFEERVSLKCETIRQDMRELARRLENGDESQLICWIKQNELGCTVRPLRRHPRYALGRLTLPPEARPLVDDWITLGFRNENLLDHLKDVGFQVSSCPYEDPHYKKSSPQEKSATLVEVRKRALIAFRTLPKPVLIMCSSGIDRSAPVAAFIVETESVAHT
jgi:hypothetical protein